MSAVAIAALASLCSVGGRGGDVYVERGGKGHQLVERIELGRQRPATTGERAARLSALNGGYTSNNDLTGLTVSAPDHDMLSANNYTFTGNALTLAGATSMDSPSSGSPNLRWQIRSGSAAT
jgi:hypothetical protein